MRPARGSSVRKRPGSARSDVKSLKIRLLGDPVLCAKAKRIEVIDDSIRELSAKMIQAMYDSNGIGLAGNQVGVLQRIVVIHVEPAEDKEGRVIPPDSPGEQFLLPKMPITLINPEIVSFSEDTCTYEEGCLSVPKLYADVVRSRRIVLKSLLLDGSSILLECGGLLARCVQHELDHLDGVVFVQRAEEEAYQAIEPGLRKMIRKSGCRNFTVRRLV